MKLSIIVPCYNEEKGISHLVAQLDPAVNELKKDYDVELILIDDGSTDNTYNLLKKYYSKKKGAIIIKHKKNMNLGGALKTGFKIASGDLVATIDSDCTYPPKEIINMLKLMKDDVDIVTASPYHPKGKVENVPAYRLLLSKTISKLYSILLNCRISTYTALFRIYRKDVIKNIKNKSNDFLGVTEMLILPILAGYKVVEYPTTLHVRKYGSSKIKLFNIIFSHLKFLVKLINYKLFKISIK